jgi:hypothetical protein
METKRRSCPDEMTAYEGWENARPFRVPRLRDPSVNWRTHPLLFRSSDSDFIGNRWKEWI